jgi:hypothetical protein
VKAIEAWALEVQAMAKIHGQSGKQKMPANLIVPVGGDDLDMLRKQVALDVVIARQNYVARNTRPRAPQLIQELLREHHRPLLAQLLPPEAPGLVWCAQYSSSLSLPLSCRGGRCVIWAQRAVLPLPQSLVDEPLEEAKQNSLRVALTGVSVTLRTDPH